MGSNKRADQCRREATPIDLDQRLFVLDPNAFKRFAALLDKVPSENQRLQRLFAVGAHWESQGRQE